MKANRWKLRPRSLVHRRQGGATVVEMALVLPVYLLLLVGLIELSLMFFVNLTMQYAVREGGRYAITGLADADPSSANQQRYKAVIERMKTTSMGLFSKVTPVITTNNVTYTDSTSYNAAMFGQAGDILVIRLDCAWPMATPLMKPFFKDGMYRFTVAVTMLNENYAGVN
ncbi:TadE/TadG family type IV pilus assembly protein [Duganella sp. FT27W]|uniref:TadE/TadG family type IV pilus assembly protein n=1 Tax=Duganella sp. FT27W TaxID=2654636 RepID=UPI00128C0520|nr:TadE/TadG family type IV pilus assembly protein [Duganella sp. FT27W]MPQ57237.1 pilus assembly protein [Duganella sp. FT27W]